jgi:hypothetical protein
MMIDLGKGCDWEVLPREKTSGAFANRAGTGKEALEERQGMWSLQTRIIGNSIILSKANLSKKSLLAILSRRTRWIVASGATERRNP